MYRMLFFTDVIEPFTTDDGRVCEPNEYNDGFILPLGWEIELLKRGIVYDLITIEE